MEDITRVRHLMECLLRVWPDLADVREARDAFERIVSGQRLIATTPHKILSVAVCGDRLVVCTDAGVFSGAPNGPLHELKLMPNIDDLRRKDLGPDQ